MSKQVRSEHTGKIAESLWGGANMQDIIENLWGSEEKIKTHTCMTEVFKEFDRSALYYIRYTPDRMHYELTFDRVNVDGFGIRGESWVQFKEDVKNNEIVNVSVKCDKKHDIVVYEVDLKPYDSDATEYIKTENSNAKHLRKIYVEHPIVMFENRRGSNTFVIGFDLMSKRRPGVSDDNCEQFFALATTLGIDDMSINYVTDWLPIYTIRLNSCS